VAAGQTDLVPGPVGGPADTAADAVGDRAAAVGSLMAVVEMADRPEESAGSEIPTEGRAGASGVRVPYWGRAAQMDASIPVNRRARALAESSFARLSLIELNAFASVLVSRHAGSRAEATHHEGLRLFWRGAGVDRQCDFRVG
jgi:hypothetical protein